MAENESLYSANLEKALQRVCKERPHHDSVGRDNRRYGQETEVGKAHRC